MKHTIAIVSVLATVSVAHADKKERADALFKQGKKLMDQQRYSDACESFEESYKLDPGIGAQLNIAKCFEEWGKLGRAFTAYQLAEKLARDARDDRADKIKQLIATLDPEVPRLTLKIPKNAPRDFKVTMDRQPVTILGQAFVVDPGPKTIEWWVGSGPKKQKIVAVERGAESEVSLDIPKGEGASGTGARRDGEGEDDGDNTGGSGGNGDSDPDDGSGAVPRAPGRAQRIGGIALGGAGVLAIGLSSIMALRARSNYNEALTTFCGGMKNTCNPEGLDLTRDARSSANTATVIFLIGAAAVGGGVALYLLAPTGPARSGDDEEQASRYFVPTVSPDGAGLVFGGRY